MLAVVFAWRDGELRVREVTTRAALEAALHDGWHSPITVVRESRFTLGEIAAERESAERRWNRKDL